MAKNSLPQIAPVYYATAKKESTFNDYIVKDGFSRCNTNVCGNLSQLTSEISNVIRKLQSKGATFTLSDENDLDKFRLIYQYTHLPNHINKFTSKNVGVDLYVFFNKIKTAIDFKSIRSAFSLNSFCDPYFDYFFSVVKHCQDPNKYPLQHTFWKNLYEYYFPNKSRSIDYDDLCSFYNSCGIPSSDTPKHVFFAAYMDQLAINLANELAKNITTYASTKIGAVFNITEYDTIMGITRGKNNKVVLPKSNPNPNPNPTPTSTSTSTSTSNPTHPLNLILYGPPGTGKTYNTVNKALDIVEPNWRTDFNKQTAITNEREYAQQRFKYHKDTTGRIVFTTFHQSMSYEDFIEGIKPEPVNDVIKAIHKNEVSSATTITQFGDGITEISNLSRMKYQVKDGIFKKMCDLMAFLKNAMDKKIVFTLENGGGFIVAEIEEKEIKIRCTDSTGKETVAEENIDDLIASWKKEMEQKQDDNGTLQDSPYRKAIISKFMEPRVLIIDEINRGNVAQIFGELITLIEDSKRLGSKKEDMTAILPYSQKPFGVPNNLYIIGTMNTADRSVEALDTALRRRFDFEEMMPKLDSNLLKTITIGKVAYDVNLLKLLETINNRIVVLKDREHQIGHSYFMKCKTEDDLKNAFKKNIVPLLQEYFYGNYAYIGLVLGNIFVKKDEVANNPKFAELEGFSYDSGDETFYRLLKDEEWETLNLEEAIEKLGEGIVSK